MSRVRGKGQDELGHLPHGSVKDRAGFPVLATPRRVVQAGEQMLHHVIDVDEGQRRRGIVHSSGLPRAALWQKVATAEL